MRVSMPGALSMASTGLFDSKMCFLGGFPPGSQGPGPSQVDRTSSRDGSRGGQLGSSLPSFGLPCGVVQHPCLPFRASTSSMRLTSGGSASCMRLTTPSWSTCDGASRLRPLCRSALRNTSRGSQPGAFTLVRASLRHRVEFALTLWWQHLGFVPALVRRCLELLLALSRRRHYFACSLTLCPGCQRLGLSGGGSRLASGFDAGGSSARAGAAPATGNTPPRSCVSTPRVSTSPPSAFSATPTRPKGCGSMSSGNAGELPGTDSTSSACASDGFRRSGHSLRWHAAQWQRPLPVDFRARGCQVVNVKMNNVEGLCPPIPAIPATGVRVFDG
jgi:hypothetical protein